MASINTGHTVNGGSPPQIVTPSIIENPVGGTIIERDINSAHVLSVVADNASTYQLQRFNGAWDNVTGATSSSTTLSGQDFTIDDSGVEYRYEVTSITNVSVYSNLAVIEVTQSVDTDEVIREIVSFHGDMLQLDFDGTVNKIRFDGSIQTSADI